MNPKIVFFDCAQTLIEVKWKIGEFAVETAEHLGMSLKSGACDRYMALFKSRLGLYQEVNLTKDHQEVRRFWIDLDRSFLSDEGADGDMAEAMVDAADARLFHEASHVFRPFADVIPCLTRLKERGIKMGVISNWDMTLHRVLEMFGLTSFFDVVIASLEEGTEKPHPRLFELALERTGFKASEAIHIGDDAFDDLQGARSAGLRAALVDRTRTHTLAPFLASLDDLELAFSWPKNQAAIQPG